MTIATSSPHSFFSVKAQTGQTACDLAPAGHYVPNFPSNTESIACPAGSYASKAGSARCITCPGGRYQVDLLPCWDGRVMYEYNSLRHTPSFIFLHDHRYFLTTFLFISVKPQTGQTTCIQASAGRYVPHSTDPTAAAESIACPAGSYTSVRGSRECRSCPVGHYQSTPGSAYGPGSGQGCFLCPPGMVAVSSRSKACSYCPGLKYPNKVVLYISVHDTFTAQYFSVQFESFVCACVFFSKPEGGATQCVGACGKGAIVLAFDDKGNPWCQECPINTFEVCVRTKHVNLIY